MSQNLNLVQKLAKVRDVASVVSKDKKGYGYNYTDILEILALVTGAMKTQGISLIPKVVPGTTRVEVVQTVDTKTAKDGTVYDKKSTEMLVTGDMIFTWLNDENPEEHIDVPWYVVGSQSDPSQAFGSGLTYCTRYFLTSYFQIGQTEQDVDDYRSKQKAAEEAEDRSVADSIISEFDTMLRVFLADNPDKKEDVTAFIGRYAKKSNYLAIKDPVIAGKLATDFKAEFITGE